MEEDIITEKVNELSKKILEICSGNDFEIVKTSLLNVRDYFIHIESSLLSK